MDTNIKWSSVHCPGWVEPRGPKDSPVKTVCREASWEENEASLRCGVGQRSQVKEEAEAASRMEYGKRQHICFGDRVSCD